MDHNTVKRESVIKLQQNRDQSCSQHMTNRYYTKNKVTDHQLSFRNSGHLAKRLTSAYREYVFLWAAAVYFSSICQERVAMLPPPLSCKFNFWHSQDCGGLSIDRNRLLFLFFGLFFRASQQQSISVSKPQWVYLEVGAIYRNHVNQAWISTEVAVDLEHFKHLQKNDADRGKNSL